MHFEETYRVGSRDIDSNYHCRPSSLLGMLQETATAAACQLHVSRDEMLEKYNGFWMLARIFYRLDKPLRWGDTVTICTHHRVAGGAALYRDFDLFVDGKQAGEAVSVWVVTDANSRKLMRLRELIEFNDTSGGAMSKTMLLPKLSLPQDMELSGQRTFYYSDTDANQHVNNTRYADCICDAVHLERLEAGQFVSSLHVGFAAECLPGETVELFTAQRDGLWYVRGADGVGRSRFDGSLGITPIAP